jgi:hypothetical protein
VNLLSNPVELNVLDSVDDTSSVTENLKRNGFRKCGIAVISLMGYELMYKNKRL